MIPREILKKIRQIEIRTNRSVTDSAELGCVRSTRCRPSEFTHTSTNHPALWLGLAWSILLLCSLPTRAEEDRLWMDAKINGQPVKFIFDTGTSGACLFPNSAKRLGLKFHYPDDPGPAPSPRAVPVAIAEECDFTFMGQTMQMRFNVSGLLKDDLTDADGILGWGAFKKGIFYIDAGWSNVVLLAEVPEKAKTWKKFNLRSDTRIVIFEVPENGTTNHVVLDTGDAGGLALAPEMWRNWKADHPAQRVTIGEAYLPAAGLFLSEKSWAKKFAVGPLLLKEVPVYEAHSVQVQSSSSVASIGLRAMRQLQVVIDGKQGMAYVHAWDRKPEPYEHNRLGAVFIPSDPDNEDDLVAHVASDSPAQKAGIQNGDVLLKINDLDVTKDPTIVANKYWNQPKGTEFRLKLRQGRHTNDVVVKLENILGPEGP